jgi:hypothetical protein
MQIPLCVVFAPDGSREYLQSSLSDGETDSLISSTMDTLRARTNSYPNSPFMGILHRHSSVQVFGFVSSSRWTIILGVENGPFEGNDVARACSERIMSAISDSVCNPFFSRLSSSSSFITEVKSAIQSHSVMMNFVATGGLG